MTTTKTVEPTFQPGTSAGGPGIEFTETYDGTDDAAKLGRLLFAKHGLGTARSIATFDTRIAPPDTLYGAGIGSNYQAQGLKLSKHFRV